MKPVHATTRGGGYWAKRGYLSRARRALELANAQATRVQELRSAAEDPASGKRSGRKVPLVEITDVHLYSEAATAFAAMSVEAFLNLYGVVRLGEDFYQRHYERLGLGAKVAALVATCMSRLVEKDDEILVVASRLYASRNSLVHPKAKEITANRQNSDKSTPHERAAGSVEDAERFFALFVALDPDSETLVEGA